MTCTTRTGLGRWLLGSDGCLAGWLDQLTAVGSRFAMVTIAGVINRRMAVLLSERFGVVLAAARREERERIRFSPSGRGGALLGLVSVVPRVTVRQVLAFTVRHEQQVGVNGGGA